MRNDWGGEPGKKVEVAKWDKRETIHRKREKREQVQSLKKEIFIEEPRISPFRDVADRTKHMKYTA